MTDRAQAFLDGAGWGTARRVHLAGDASDRRYARLTGPQGTAVLMDNPPGGADDPAAFVRMARHLTGLGLSAPQVLASDVPAGLLLLEDLGDGLFARLLERDPGRETALYAVATDALIEVQRHPAPEGLPDLSALDWAKAAAFALDWYAFAATGTRPDPAAFTDMLAGAGHPCRWSACADPAGLPCGKPAVAAGAAGRGAGGIAGLSTRADGTAGV